MCNPPLSLSRDATMEPYKDLKQPFKHSKGVANKTLTEKTSHYEVNVQKGWCKRIRRGVIKGRKENGKKFIGGADLLEYLKMSAPPKGLSPELSHNNPTQSSGGRFGDLWCYRLQKDQAGLNETCSFCSEGLQQQRGGVCVGNAHFLNCWHNGSFSDKKFKI